MDIVLLVLSLALAGTCAGIWLWLQAHAVAVRLRRENDRLETRIVQQTQALRRALTTAEAQVERLTAEDRTKGEVMQALGRELRTPLTTVMGFPQLLRINAEADPLTARQSQAVRQIEAAGAVLLALVEEADAFMTSGDAGASPSIHRVDLRLALRQVCDGVEPQAREAGVTLACPPPASGLCVMADPGQVRRILRRLVENALRHSPGGGTVRMEMRRDDSQVIVAIHDAGATPTREGSDRLFHPLDGQDARGGTTLGVASIQRLAERMGGAIAQQREPWGGTVFSLSLPAVGARSVSSPKPAVVLYVEDNPANIALMRQAAAGLGLTLHAATTGPEGLELARALRPDVILLDIGLPDMDGYEVKARLDADPMTRHVPVLALTAAVSPQDRTRGAAAGFDAWLAKPLDLTALAAALNDVLGSAPATGGLDADRRQRA
ncbi:hybrid sensor histidine kinase/response regulator [Brevundimonas sp. G8]|uniref:hybrid sensor histidine kinase/response regulator n=1 Tax=Brevundimonas sp. G8 TaxID=1350776 RepID=UPI0012F36F2D|nr:hybrid sensor histidine kinase/response regulator [Brevundimonas sp. G8]VXA97144.1 putative Histidine kinase [Brevundimonas sp. G8]